MKSIPEMLLLEMQHQLDIMHLEISEPIQHSAEAIRIIITTLEKLKTWIIKYKFGCKAEEIEFFREIKPKFTSVLIFYNSIYNIELSKPVPQKVIRKYYRQELEKLQVFYLENLEFYKYYRRDARYLDHKYFIRGQYDISLTLDSFYFQADSRFSTSHDYKVAEILAYEQLQVYLETELGKLRSHSSANAKSGQLLKWTGSKVALIELLYALHTEGVFNNGAVDLKDIIAFFSKSFEMDLTQFHRTFFEISSRKSDRTKFLRSLADNLTRRMDQADQHK